MHKRRRIIKDFLISPRHQHDFFNKGSWVKRRTITEIAFCLTSVSWIELNFRKIPTSNNLCWSEEGKSFVLDNKNNSCKNKKSWNKVYGHFITQSLSVEVRGGVGIVGIRSHFNYGWIPTKRRSGSLDVAVNPAKSFWSGYTSIGSGNISGTAVAERDSS